MRVVSYAWFRSDTSIYESETWSKTKRGHQFAQFLALVVRAHHSIWPGWELRIYYDDRVMSHSYFNVLVELEDADLIALRYGGKCESLCGANGMLARMRPAFESGVDYVACRDIDSVPCPRDRRAVEEFIFSG